MPALQRFDNWPGRQCRHSRHGRTHPHQMFYWWNCRYRWNQGKFPATTCCLYSNSPDSNEQCKKHGNHQNLFHNKIFTSFVQKKPLKTSGSMYTYFGRIGRSYVFGKFYDCRWRLSEKTNPIIIVADVR
jgi:hypothetical protein